MCSALVIECAAFFAHLTIILSMIGVCKADNRIELDIALLQKYNVPGPRYTSYPTALQFAEMGDSAELMDDVQTADRPLSLYFHLPFCQSRCWFCGCTRIITTDSALADRYIEYLDKEMALIAARIRPGREVVQMHFGGGTPNFLSPEQIERLGLHIHRHFQFNSAAEVSVELDPRQLTEEQVKAFRAMGVNRASMGIQDCNPRVQKAIHRIQPTETNEMAVRRLRRAGIESLNFDLVYGLPHQDVEGFEKTLDEVLRYEPARFSIFSYAHIPWKQPAQKILERSPLPSAEEKLMLLKTIVSKLTSAGYVHVGMDHFAKPDDPLVKARDSQTLQRNFQGYSTHADTDIFAFGVSSISQTESTYRQNIKTLPEYYRMLDEGVLPIERGYCLSDDDKIRRRVIMRVMCDMKLDFKEMSEVLGVSFKDYFSDTMEAMQALVEDSLVTLSEDELELTEQGRFFVRNVAMLFDAYYASKQQAYSKTV